MEKFMPLRVQMDYEYQESLLCGATIDIPLSYQLDIFKHETKPGEYCATEQRTQLVEYKNSINSQEDFINWVQNLHMRFSSMPRYVKVLMARKGLDMSGNTLSKSNEVTG